MTVFDTGSQKHRLSFDVAIYGTGPSGITLALALAGTGLRIGLFEAGGPNPPVLDREHPYQGSNRGLPYDLAGTRLRYLGGTSNHWGGWCRPLDPYDFSARVHIPLSGWPISRDELNPHLEAALDVCEVPTGGLGLQAFDHDFGYDGFLHRAVPEFQVKNFLFSTPTRFGTRYLQDLRQADDIDCYLNSSLVRLAASGDAVDTALVMGPDRSETLVRARCHVLAMGAIENARMLLHSNVANQSGFVGRCFADHLGRTIGIALLDFSNRYLLHHVRAGDQYIRALPHLSLAEDAMRDGEFANFGVIIDHKGTKKLPLGDDGKQVQRQLGRLNRRHAHRFRMLVRMENTPNPDSRITLTNDRDAYGVPRVALNWQVNPFDLECVGRLCRLLAQRIGGAGGRVRIDYSLEKGNRRPGTYQAHHLGTTRMSADPENGVVDRNLRCHEVANLYVAGSSVFPTFGFANPTLTIVGLSLRLAQHLRHELRGIDA